MICIIYYYTSRTVMLRSNVSNMSLFLSILYYYFNRKKKFKGFFLIHMNFYIHSSTHINILLENKIYCNKCQ